MTIAVILIVIICSFIIVHHLYKVKDKLYEQFKEINLYQNHISQSIDRIEQSLYQIDSIVSDIEDKTENKRTKFNKEMKAYIYFNSKSKGLDYDGEGEYVLVTEDNKCIGSHYCSSRSFANHDLTEWRLEELQENNISEVYSNGELVWKNQEMTENAKDGFYKANADYESKYCNKMF